MTMRVPFFILLLCAPAFVCAQCPDELSRNTPALTPTIRALLMLERPAAMSVEQWEKVIENPNNRQDLQIKIYKEETIDPCDLPPNDWYIILPGRRPPEKDPRVAVKSAH
jgi:hypothetical protein